MSSWPATLVLPPADKWRTNEETSAVNRSQRSLLTCDNWTVKFLCQTCVVKGNVVRKLGKNFEFIQLILFQLPSIG